MVTKKILLIVTTLIIFGVTLVFLPYKVKAAVRCETQYGGGQICTTTGEIQINKAVWDPDHSVYVDNLFADSHRFGVGDEIMFRLGVKNVGNDTLDSVHVTDTLPAHLEVSSGSTDFFIFNLAPNESRDFFFKARVKNDLPNNSSVICAVNTAFAQTNNSSDQDTAQVCLMNKVLGVTSLPPTGPSGTLFLFSLAILLIIAAIYLKLNKNINFGRG